MANKEDQEKEIGRIEDEQAMFIRKQTGLAEIISEQEDGYKHMQFELSFDQETGLPIIRNEHTGKFFVLEWEDIIALSLYRGLDSA